MNVIGHNSPEWVVAFMGTLTNDCVCSGIYTTNNAEACVYQVDHSEAEVVVMDSIE